MGDLLDDPPADGKGLGLSWQQQLELEHVADLDVVPGQDGYGVEGDAETARDRQAPGFDPEGGGDAREKAAIERRSVGAGHDGVRMH